MRMKKVVTAAMVAGMLLVPLSASASASAPRARTVPAAPRAAAVTTAQNGTTAPQSFEGAQDAQFCLNLDKDNRWGCILGGNPGSNCHQVFQITPLITYWRCGHITKPPTPPGCLNLDGDRRFTCLGEAKPEGPCRETFSLLFIHRYFCYGEGSGLLPGRMPR
jgi:hypothetical protein